MADYMVEIGGDNDLAEIDREIRFEELHPSQFVKSSLSFHESKFTNLATFHPIPFGDQPKEFKLALASIPAPDGFEKVWTGTMLVAGSNALVSAYRKTG